MTVSDPPCQTLLSLRDLIYTCVSAGRSTSDLSCRNEFQYSIDESACRFEAAGELGNAFDACRGSFLIPTTGSYEDSVFPDSADAQGLEGQFSSTSSHQTLPLDDPSHAALYDSARVHNTCWDESPFDEGMNGMSFESPPGPSKTYV